MTYPRAAPSRSRPFRTGTNLRVSYYRKKRRSALVTRVCTAGVGQRTRTGYSHLRGRHEITERKRMEEQFARTGDSTERMG